jgi:hypothetical protein
MNAVPIARHEGRARIIVLWACIGWFFLRVIGQVEVLLLAPPWLPPIAAGGIPVAFHWVLALFLLVLSRPARS